MSDAPVLIVGGGATGAMLALLLAQQQVRSTIVEARPAPYDVPRAHALNPRSLEICRSLGLDLERMRREAAPRDEAGRVRFVTRLFGPEFGDLPYERQDDAARDFSPTPLINLPQTAFEPILFDAVSANPLIDYRRGVTWTGFFREGRRLTSTLVTATGATTLSSRFVIGCDGAGSAVRQSLGVAMSGDPAVLSCLSIVFRADLRAQLAERPGILFWVNDPATPGTFLAYHMDRLWTFVQMHPPGPINMSLYDPEACRRIVVEAAGGDIPDLEILQAAPWTMTSQVADRYGGDGVYVAGDAAHRFPPTGGLGLNTGIQDAHNLAWKLAAVLDGRADEGLLDTYETERRPVAVRNAAQSLVNAQRLAALAALQCPREVWSDAAAFAAWLGQGDRAGRIAEAIALQQEHFDSFGLQLGFVYGRSEAPDAVDHYTPAAEPGCRLPHAWLRSDGALSTLDLVDPTRFVLFAPPGATAEGLEGVLLISSADERLPDDFRRFLPDGPGEGLLVRPDGHVACRGPLTEVADALSALMGARRLGCFE